MDLAIFYWDLAIFNNHKLVVTTPSWARVTAPLLDAGNQSELPLYHYMHLTHELVNQSGSQSRLHDMRFGNQSDEAALGDTGLSAT
jgi:hypothetical protein